MLAVPAPCPTKIQRRPCRHGMTPQYAEAAPRVRWDNLEQ